MPPGSGWTECGQVTLTYTNPTVHTYWGDYRIGEEPGTPDEYADHVPDEGPWAGTPLGDRYNSVELPAGQTVTQVIEVEEDTTVTYWVNRGPENQAWAAVQSVDVVACQNTDDNDDNGKGEGEDAKPTPDVEDEGGKGGPGEGPQKGAAGGTPPVTGGALAGLVVAALATAGAGGGALYLSRKRKAAADAE